MTIITPPSPFSSVKKPVIFGIDRPHASVCEVVINGYHKTLSNDASQVNAAPYFRENFDVFPLLEQNSIFMSYDGGDIYRLNEASISVDGVDSNGVPLIYADTQPTPSRFMSNLHQRVIDRGEIDEIAVHLEAPGVLIYNDERLALPKGISYIGFQVPVSARDIFTIRLTTTDEVDLDSIEYTVETNSGTRFAWVNPYGAIDYWNFSTKRKVSTKVTKTRIYSSEGYLTTQIQSEATRMVCSQPLSERICEALSWIVSSDATWIIKNGEAHSVDITNEGVTLFEQDNLSCMQIDYRSKIRSL